MKFLHGLVFSLLLGTVCFSSPSVLNSYWMDGNTMMMDTYDKRSVALGACMQAYICKKLHRLSNPFETLDEVEQRIGEERIDQITYEAKLTCVR